MSVSVYDPDTGFTRDVELAWRFDREKPWREDPWDALMEAPSNAHMLYWNGGDIPCAPVLCEFADEMAHQAQHTTDLLNSDWARHWAHACWLDAGPVVGARGAARHFLLCHHNDPEMLAYVKGVFAGLCSKEKGIL